MKSSISYFNTQNSINTDECAISAKDKQNNSIENYMTYNYFKGNSMDDCTKFDKSKIRDFAIDTQMTIRDGYGVGDACIIDNDSKIRNEQIWDNTREKNQLFSRVFQGIPNINKGGLIPITEDRVKQGEYNYLKKGCDRLSEQQFPVFTPMIDCLANTIQKVEHIVPSWEGGSHGGQPSRDFVQQSKFLEQNGYVMDSGTWRKKYCSGADRI